VVKIIQKSTIHDAGEYFNEASILYLSSHPNVVPVHYACEDVDAIYILMPYYQNGSLKRRMGSGFLTVREIVRYSTQFLSGLHNIHSKGLIHFDVKSDNILLSDRDEAMLADFGLAKQVDYSGLAGQDRIYNKMRPPETFLGDQFSRSFDLYQAGLTLYRMANGEANFYSQFGRYLVWPTAANPIGFDRDAFKFAVRNERFPDRNSYLEHIPTRLRNTINKCLKADPHQRYTSAIDVVNDLADITTEYLDWRYQGSTGTGRQWVKEVGGTRYQLTIDPSGVAAAEKKVGDAIARRIAAYCRPTLSGAEIKRFLKAH